MYNGIILSNRCPAVEIIVRLSLLFLLKSQLVIIKIFASLQDFARKAVAFVFLLAAHPPSEN